LVESILQTIYASGADPNAKILVCAPSNTATDVVVERLAPYVSSREMIRVMAYSREKRSVPESIIKFANYDDASDCFVMPDVDVLKQYKIVAVTVSYGGRLYNNGIQDHFTHVFLDEAGHSIEAEAIACLALVTKHSESDPPVTVLAGDPKQLGPIIRSDIGKKFGLEKSLLERVSERECYARSDECDDLGYYYDRRMITKLVRNYRSHPHILKLPNDEFYDGDLIPAADITRSHRFVAWEHLPRRKFPIVFHGVEGEDMREANSPSWFNPEEVQYVKMYVDLLVMETQQNRCKPEDIGIITPYHKQAQKIRFLLTAHGYDGCKVGSVEEFQGSERPVIIISTVRSTVDHINLDLKHKLGFLANKKRFNVAITRAQALLIMIGNPFTLENDPNWKSMIDYCIEGGGYTGVDYVMMEKRIESTAAVEDIIVGIQSILLNDAASAENDEGDGDFLLVSHVTAQEGPAWKSEE
jgi:superfamily I DNA and/or RNA helicase